MPDMLTVEGVCDRYDLRPAMVYTMKRKGQIPYTKIGKLLRFPVKLLERWEAGRTFLPKSMK